MPQDRDPVESEDYIVIRFEQPVLATKILIYETFNPGAVVRIWSGRGHGLWSLLYFEPPKKYTAAEAVLFSPKIKIIPDLIE